VLHAYLKVSIVLFKTNKRFQVVVNTNRKIKILISKFLILVLQFYSWIKYVSHKKICRLTGYPVKNENLFRISGGRTLIL